MMAQNNMYSRHNDSDNTSVVQSTHTANTLKQPQQSSAPQVTNASTLKTEDQQTNNDNTEELNLKIKDMSVGNVRGECLKIDVVPCLSIIYLIMLQYNYYFLMTM